jgi:hypothetical protein
MDIPWPATVPRLANSRAALGCYREIDNGEALNVDGIVSILDGYEAYLTTDTAIRGEPETAPGERRAEYAVQIGAVTVDRGGKSALFTDATSIFERGKNCVLMRPTVWVRCVLVCTTVPTFPWRRSGNAQKPGRGSQISCCGS